MRVMPSDGLLSLPSSSKPVEEQWPYADYDPAGFVAISVASEELRGSIGLRTGGPDRRADYYLDSERDFICA